MKYEYTDELKREMNRARNKELSRATDKITAALVDFSLYLTATALFGVVVWKMFESL